jgi:hypothetical protein
VKTKGQRLYEAKHPEYIAVVLAEGRQFATAADVFIIKHPHHPTPWRFLTQDSQASWEKTAIGHNLVTP